MNVLFTLLFLMTTQQTIVYPWPQLSMKCYPEELMPGDSLYLVLEAMNPYERSIFVQSDLLNFDRDIQFRIVDSQNQSVQILVEVSNDIELQRGINRVEHKPGETWKVSSLAINLPALEDIHDPFWEKHLKDLPPEGRKFFLEATLTFHAATTQRGEPGRNYPQSFTLRQKLLLKPRPANEMVWIKDLFSNTPKEFFPIPKENNHVRKIPRVQSFPFVSNHVNIRIGDKKYDQWKFVRFANRYPSDPNAPVTWQGWKELEESITPSTMRDEIRLTRMLIQYCDTKDAKVLEELKEWFAGMNEIQRAYLVYFIGVQTREYGGNSTVIVIDQSYSDSTLVESFREIYRVVYEYSTTSKPDWMQELGSLE